MTTIEQTIELAKDGARIRFIIPTKDATVLHPVIVPLFKEKSKFFCVLPGALIKQESDAIIDPVVCGMPRNKLKKAWNNKALARMSLLLIPHTTKFFASTGTYNVTGRAIKTYGKLKLDVKTVEKEI